MAKVSDSDTAGTGPYGRPKRWTGGGPRPARHIPWPELFKHHQSVLTGHLKMMDMVRKHCVEGSGNYETAKACVDRTHQMMKMFKEVMYNFVPPKDNLDKVPLGASSASMYPGYSPADHIYGEAAQEYGERAAELKRKGMDLKLDPSGPQYVVGQNKKPRRLSHELEQTHSASVSSGSAHNAKDHDEDGEPMEGVEQSTDVPQYFVIDSKPTPLDDLGEMQKQKNKANDKAKRRVSFKEERKVVAASAKGSDALKAEKSKLSATDSMTAIDARSTAQEEDISVEVEARLKVKEEKRKRKEEKKRKRDSGESQESIQTTSSMILADVPAKRSSTEKHKRKMHKQNQNEISGASEISVKANDDEEPRKDKRKKKRSAAADEEEAAASACAEIEKPKKRRRKDTTSSN